MAHPAKSPRERAARALCKLDRNRPDVTFLGRPMWTSYLPEVDAVLRSVLGEKSWAAMIEGIVAEVPCQQDSDGEPMWLMVCHDQA